MAHSDQVQNLELVNRLVDYLEDYRVRLFYFVFAVLLYNIWRLTDFLLKAGVYGETDYAPVLTAGECVKLIASALIPPD